MEIPDEFFSPPIDYSILKGKKGYIQSISWADAERTPIPAPDNDTYEGVCKALKSIFLPGPQPPHDLDYEAGGDLFKEVLAKDLEAAGFEVIPDGDAAQHADIMINIQFIRIIMTNKGADVSEGPPRPRNSVEIITRLAVGNVAFGYKDVAEIYDKITYQNVSGFDLNVCAFMPYMQAGAHAVHAGISEALANYYLYGTVIKSAAPAVAPPRQAPSEAALDSGFAEKSLAREGGRRAALVLCLLVALIAFLLLRQFGPDIFLGLRSAFIPAEAHQEWAKFYNERGFQHLEKDRLDLALADFNKALAKAPGYAAAYQGRGCAYGRKGQYDQAIADLNRALEINPQDAASYEYRAYAYFGKKEYDQAWQADRQAQELGRKVNPGFLQALGQVNFPAKLRERRPRQILESRPGRAPLLPGSRRG